MTKTEFNKLFDDYFHQHLAQLGFKKAGCNYYLHTSPKLMMIKNGWDFSNDIMICYSVDYISKFTNQKGEFEFKPSLNYYQIAIPTQTIRHQYNLYDKVEDFKFDLNFRTRKCLTTRNRIPTNINLLVHSLQTPSKLNKKYLSESIQIIKNEGMKLLDQFNSGVGYLVLDKYPEELLDPYMIDIKEEIKSNLVNDGKPIPNYSNNLIDKIWIWKHIRKMRKILN